MSLHPANLEQHILLARGQKVMLDADLARLYGVPTKVLLQAVKRNCARFPEDFVFQLSKDECGILRSPGVTSKSGWGGRRYLPYVFTEQGVVMLSSVLRSEQAIAVNVEIMRQKFAEVFAAIRALTAPPQGAPPPRRPIGFVVTDEKPPSA